MEKWYRDELGRLGFTANPELAPPVLELRAYHNTYDDITDCSYAEINIPVYLPEAAEKKIKKAVFETIAACHRENMRDEIFWPGRNPAAIGANYIQLKYPAAMGKEKIVANVKDILQRIFEDVREGYFELSPSAPDYQKRRRFFTLIGKRLKMIELFIDAGSVTYDYHTEHYDPLS